LPKKLEPIKQIPPPTKATAIKTSGKLKNAKKDPLAMFAAGPTSKKF